MYPHRIRLRGPWELELLCRREVDESGRKSILEHWIPIDSHRPIQWTSLPEEWEKQTKMVAFPARSRGRRRFGYPGRIDAHERVWLTFGGFPTAAEVWLNTRHLGRQQEERRPFEFEVTQLLEARNELVIELAPPKPGDVSAWGEIALEVRAAAFLRNVRLWAEVRGEKIILHAAGEVVGECERPLELYVILDRTNVAYARVEAGRLFEVASEPLDAERCQPSEPPHRVRIELVNGATVWYAQECEFGLA